ncbi:MAG: porin family protein, partial [Mesorhizobium sp.]
ALGLDASAVALDAIVAEIGFSAVDEVVLLPVVAAEDAADEALGLNIRAAGEILLYGTGGLAAKNQKVEGGGFSDSKGMLGWTAGVGTDIKITDNVFGRVEYRYSDYGDKDFDGFGNVKSKDNRVTFGVGMKF